MITLPPRERQEIVRLILSGSKVAAVTKVRQLTGAGLKDAKDYVDSLAAKVGCSRSSAEQRVQPAVGQPADKSSFSAEQSQSWPRLFVWGKMTRDQEEGAVSAGAHSFYTRAEEIANSLTHGLGAGLSVAGLIILVVLVLQPDM